jgi:hypothetical protein
MGAIGIVQGGLMVVVLAEALLLGPKLRADEASTAIAATSK